MSFEPVVGGDVARSDDCDDCDTVTTMYGASLHCMAVICNIYFFHALCRVAGCWKEFKAHPCGLSPFCTKLYRYDKWF